MNIKDALYVGIHLSLAARTKVRQGLVGADMEHPPLGTTIEAFVAMPVYEAMVLMAVDETTSRQESGGGVQLGDWTTTDQQRLLRGELPQGVPNHRDV